MAYLLVQLVEGLHFIHRKSSLLSQDVGILIFFSPFELLGGHTPHADELRIEDQKTTTSVSSR
jgi:hypothetical protein